MVSHKRCFVNIEFVFNNAIDFFNFVIYNMCMKNKNIKKTKEQNFLTDAKLEFYKQSLVKKIFKKIGIGLGATGVVAVSTISIINSMNTGGTINKPYKPPIVIPTAPDSTKEPTITITIEPSNSTPSPIVNPIFSSYTKSQLEDAGFAMQFLWSRILDDVNHDSSLISNSAQFVNFNNNLNTLSKNVEFIIEDNGKFFVVTYLNKTDKEVYFDTDYADPSASISELTTMLFEKLSLSSVKQLESISDKTNELLSKFVVNQTSNNVVHFLGVSNSYKSSTIFDSENECADLYGYSLTDGVYKNCKLTFGRLTSNYYSTTLTEDISSFVKEYDTYFNITDEQLHDLYNKYSLSHNVSDDLFIEPNTMSQLLLLVQLYEEEKTNLSNEQLVYDFVSNFDSSSATANIINQNDDEENVK